MEISNRIRGFQASPIRRLSPYARAAKERGIKVYHLNIGQPDIRSPKEAIEAIHSYPNDIIAYGESDGDLALRKALVKYYHDYVDVDITVDDILITTGGSEAILFSLMTLCDPGDEIIVPEPYYTNVHSFARMANVSIVPVTSTLEDNFALPPLSLIEERITSKTRAILLNSPNNPTGHIYSPKELETIIGMCRDHDIFLIMDEVYREFCYDNQKFTSVLKYTDCNERIICIDSVSKRFSMCGARVGALICRNRNVIRETLKLSQARLCSPTVEQYASLAAFGAPPAYLENVKAEYEKRRNFIVKALRSIPGVKCSRPNGAFYLIARLPVEDAEDFSIFMLRDFSYNGETVMLAPAEGFYESKDLGRDQVRIAYVLNTDDLEKACICLKEGLKAYNNRTF
ncbi:MAG: pyridoxal phosphate-dependent aminotransferase [Spirochaetales bacterium]|nr:pyridoxal phosphate-dependent aminotransferase [Spirochaetales bacterium]